MYWMFLPFRRYFDFSGRSRRMEYWMFVLFNLFVALALVALNGAMGGNIAAAGDSTATADASGLLLLLYPLAIAIPMLAVQVRRFHDQDKSGWYILLMLLPYVGSMVMVYFMVQKGTEGDNSYGPDPLQPDLDISAFM